MLQSNSCNYLQSVDNRGPTKRLLTHKHGGGRDVSRGMEGKISQRKKRKMVAMLVLGGKKEKKETKKQIMKQQQMCTQIRQEKHNSKESCI